MVKAHRRGLIVGAASVCAAVGLVGIMHLPIARPVLQLFAGLCPVNSVSADLVETLQTSASANLGGTEPIPSRDTFALRMLFGGREAVDAWRTTSRTNCEEFTRGFAYVDCDQIPTDMGERHLIVSFDRAGQSRSVDVISASESPAGAAARAEMIVAALAHHLGSPHERSGHFAADYLDAPFRSASVVYRYSNAVVTLRATNVPGSGVLVEETYVSPGVASSLAMNVSTSPLDSQ
jgi:hypothetical protein